MVLEAFSTASYIWAGSIIACLIGVGMIIYGNKPVKITGWILAIFFGVISLIFLLLFLFPF